MSSVQSILAAIHLPKTLWNRLIEMVAYVKNLSLDINGIRQYELSNNVLPDFSHLKVLDSRTWVHILKEKRLRQMYTLGKEFLLVMTVKIIIVFTIHVKKSQYLQAHDHN